MTVETRTVCVTGAAGQIAYALLPLIASGKIYGKETKINLHLLDIPPAMTALSGVVMELEDGAYPLLQDVVATDDVTIAFKGCDLAILLGAMPRRQGMERKDLLKANCGIFKVQGQAMEKYASRNLKVLVVGNPANTNALVCQHYAPSIPKENFTALTRLDHNRMKGALAKGPLKEHLQSTGGSVDDIHDCIIWGNHSNTQYADANHVRVGSTKITSIVPDTSSLQGDFLKAIQVRGATVIKARGNSSAMSAANAAADHCRDWMQGGKDYVSMAVTSDGSYGIKKGLLYSFPVLCGGTGEYKIVSGLDISDFSREMMQATERELIEERDEALAFLE